MKKIFIFHYLFIVILTGCNSFKTKTISPELMVKWKYENKHIKFTIINRSESSIIMELPIATDDLNHNSRTIDYNIFYKDTWDGDNPVPGRIGYECAYVSNKHYKIISGVPKKVIEHYIRHNKKPPLFIDGNFDIIIVPLAKSHTFKDIIQIKIYINAVPLEALSTIKDYPSFRKLFSARNIKTYVVDFYPKEHDKTEGLMKLETITQPELRH
jgi:hypothetical protein